MRAVTRPVFIVDRLSPFASTSYCYKCRRLVHDGEEIEFREIPITFRYGKQQKKAKASTHHTHMQHVNCPEAL